MAEQWGLLRRPSSPAPSQMSSLLPSSKPQWSTHSSRKSALTTPNCKQCPFQAPQALDILFPCIQPKRLKPSIYWARVLVPYPTHSCALSTSVSQGLTHSRCSINAQGINKWTNGQLGEEPSDQRQGRRLPLRAKEGSLLVPRVLKQGGCSWLSI